MSKRSKNYKDYLYKDLQKPEEASAYLTECLKDDNPEVFNLALKDVIDAHGGFKKIAQEMKENPKSLSRSFAKNGNPGINTVSDVLSWCDLSLEFKPDPSLYSAK